MALNHNEVKAEVVTFLNANGVRILGRYYDKRKSPHSSNIGGKQLKLKVLTSSFCSGVKEALEEMLDKRGCVLVLRRGSVMPVWDFKFTYLCIHSK